jgi:glycosyltransferase involved in cell wall biosynthesis
MYRISVIIPFYKGNVFLMELKHCLDKAAEKLGEKIEVIIVNDSPEIEVADDVFRSEMYDYILINNEHNVGIHKSRVIGLERANGLYILFLDQDDKINENFFVDMIAALVEDDSIAFVYANGVFEDENGTKKIILNS